MEQEECPEDIETVHVPSPTSAQAETAPRGPDEVSTVPVESVQTMLDLGTGQQSELEDTGLDRDLGTLQFYEYERLYALWKKGELSSVRVVEIGGKNLLDLMESQLILDVEDVPDDTLALLHLASTKSDVKQGSKSSLVKSLQHSVEPHKIWLDAQAMSDDELDPGLQGYSDSGSDFHDLPEPPLPEDVRKTASTAPPAGGWTLKRPTAGDAVKLRLAEPDPAATGYQDEQGLVCLDLGAGGLPRLEAAATSLRFGEVATFRFDKGLQGDSTARSLELTLVDWTPRVDLFQDKRAIKSLLSRGDDRRRPVIGQVCLLRCSLRRPGQGNVLWERQDLEHVIEDMPPPESSHRFEFGIKEGWKLMDKAIPWSDSSSCGTGPGPSLIKGPDRGGPADSLVKFFPGPPQPSDPSQIPWSDSGQDRATLVRFPGQIRTGACPESEHSSRNLTRESDQEI
eukprot:s3454_g6.t1